MQRITSNWAITSNGEEVIAQTSGLDVSLPAITENDGMQVTITVANISVSTRLRLAGTDVCKNHVDADRLMLGVVQAAPGIWLGALSVTLKSVFGGGGEDDPPSEWIVIHSDSWVPQPIGQ